MGIVRVIPNRLSGLGVAREEFERYDRPVTTTVVPGPPLVDDRYSVPVVVKRESVVVDSPTPVLPPEVVINPPTPVLPPDTLIPFEPTLTPAGADITNGIPTFIDVAQAQVNPVAKWGLIALGVGVFLWSVNDLKKKPKRRTSRRRKR